MVREVKECNIEAVKKLVHETFDEFVIDYVTDDGAKEFHTFVEEEIENQASWYYYLDGKEVAVLSVKDGNHISLFFTHKDYQNRGAAKELFEAVKTVLMARGIFDITVNASPNSLEFYQKLNFCSTGNETTENGISYIPMKYKLL